LKILGYLLKAEMLSFIGRPQTVTTAVPKQSMNSHSRLDGLKEQDKYTVAISKARRHDGSPWSQMWVVPIVSSITKCSMCSGFFISFWD
jgi:hypothetical protein